MSDTGIWLRHAMYMAMTPRQQEALRERYFGLYPALRGWASAVNKQTKEADHVKDDESVAGQ